MLSDPSRPVCDQGLSYFLTDPNRYEQIQCVICGSRCDVTRNINGPTSWAMAIGKRKRLHDRHACPHRDHPLHQLALRQRELIEQLPSGAVQALAVTDLNNTLRELQLEIELLQQK